MKVAEVARDENCGRIEWTALIGTNRSKILRFARR